MQRIMKHFADLNFWEYYYKLPVSIQQLADKNFNLLKQNPNHPSLYFKQIRRHWSVRVGMHYRALGVMSENGDIVWLWIGTHREYEKLIK